jgi:tetratricopeptide (TPR) repeat protein
VEQDECDEADRQALEALELYRVLGDQRGIGACLNTLGYSAATREDVERAAHFYEESYRAFSEVEGPFRLYAATNLAMVLTAQGDLDEARRLFTESLDYFEPRGLEDEAAIAQFRLGELEETAGDLTAARQWFEASIGIARRMGNRRLLAWALMRLGHVDADEGRLSEAAASFSEALELHSELRQPSGAASCLEYVARAACRCGRLEAAARLLGAAQARREATGIPVSDHDRPPLAATEAELRARLGEARVEEEVAAGAVLELPGLVHLLDETLVGSSPV